MREYCVASISWLKEVLSRDYAVLILNYLSVFFIVHTTIESTARSGPLNSLEHCVWTTSMTSIRLGRDSNQVHLCFEPQSNRMSHKGRPILCLYGGDNVPLLCMTNTQYFQQSVSIQMYMLGELFIFPHITCVHLWNEGA